MLAGTYYMKVKLLYFFAACAIATPFGQMISPPLTGKISKHPQHSPKPNGLCESTPSTANRAGRTVRVSFTPNFQIF
jgi:hypothetical protein